MRRNVEAAPRRDDEGLTLIEMVVTMSVMAIVMVVFTTAIAQVYWANNRIENSAVAQSQLHVAFQRFDRELRYASWIGTPAKVDSHTWYVEFAEADPTRCNRLRLDTTAQPTGGQDGTGVLQLIRWTRGTWPTGSPKPATSAWATIASNLVEGTDPPFDTQNVGAMPYATASAGQDFKTAFQRLRFRLTTRVGTNTATVDTTFSAVNSAKATQSNGCSEGRPTP
ncbi:type II secretion system protein J [Actinoplanes sp. NPDC049668]|uniref:prepilin-type N-terminal cleavage/methylation domain-containing protein n=1 Tax=unclassified Actinoplanes TaxID=2626549 RepID=UPI0033BB2BFE